MPPKAGSHIPPDDNLCIQCHGEPDLWDAKTKRLYIDRDGLAEDVHWKKGVNCNDCHGGDYKTTEVNEAHAKENGFRGAGEAARKMCVVCHENQGWTWSRASTPRPARRTSKAAARCWIAASVTGPTSTTSCRWPTAVRRCSSTTRCRPAASATRRSWAATRRPSHGHGLYQSGLLVTATCANCHGAHGIYRAADQRSTLYTANVAATCGKCHRFIAERLQASVHGRARGRAKWPNGWRRAENRSSGQAAPPATRDTKSPWPRRRDSASNCPTSAAIATPICPAAMR